MTRFHPLQNQVLKILAFCVVATIIGQPAIARKASCSAIHCTDEIDRLYVTSHAGKPRVFVSIEDRGLAEKKLNCKLVSGFYFTLDGDNPAFDEIYQLLLAAKTGPDGQNHLTFRIVENSNNCRIGYVVADWPN